LRTIDAHLAQEIADKELTIQEAGIVQHVLSHTPSIQAVFLAQKDFEELRTLLDNAARSYEEFKITLEGQDEFEHHFYSAQNLIENYVVQRDKAPTIYLTLHRDQTWFSSVSDIRQNTSQVPLVKEGSYPTNLFWTRIDMNGSDVMEMQLCRNRKEVIDHLNWIGQIGGTVEQLWDFDHNKEIPIELADIFSTGRNHRYALLSETWKEMSDEHDISDLKQLLGQAFATNDPDKEYSCDTWSIRFAGFLDGSAGQDFELSYRDTPVVFGNTFSKRLEAINSEMVPLETLLPAVEAGIPGHGFPCHICITDGLDSHGNGTVEVEGARFYAGVETYVPADIEDGYGYNVDAYEIRSLSALKDVVVTQDNQHYGIFTYDLSIGNETGIVEITPTLYVPLERQKEQAKPSLDSQVSNATSRAQHGSETAQKAHEQDTHAL